MTRKDAMTRKIRRDDAKILNRMYTHGSWTTCPMTGHGQRTHERENAGRRACNIAGQARPGSARIFGPARLMARCSPKTHTHGLWTTRLIVGRGQKTRECGSARVEDDTSEDRTWPDARVRARMGHIRRACEDKAQSDARMRQRMDHRQPA